RETGAPAAARGRRGRRSGRDAPRCACAPRTLPQFMSISLLALSISTKFTQVGAIAAFAALLGIAILSLLVFSQAREIRRLRDWAGRAPERAAEAEQRVSQAAAARLQQPAAPQAVRPVPRTAPIHARATPPPGAAPAAAATVPPGQAVTASGAPASASPPVPGPKAPAPAAAPSSGGQAPQPSAPPSAPASGQPATAAAAAAAGQAAAGQGRPASAAPAQPGAPRAIPWQQP